ncbi:MAG: thioredoxin-like domain-containing protein [Tahibacter sp.]
MNTENALERLELPSGLDWVNTDAPPRLGGLHGRVVLLYFWTFDSVNCVNFLADVLFLENRHHDGLAVIGIHTPKYPAQGASLLKAVNRHNLRHPIANDPEFLLWRELGLVAWPTAVLLDAQGQLAGIYTGEGRRQEIEKRIVELLDDATAHDRRVYETGPDALRAELRMPLAFPSRVLATDQHLYIADTGHHRILETNHEGRILRQFGSGNAGYWDGRSLDSGLSSPQGLALSRDILYFADTGNHCVRRIRLASGDVETIVGTGKAGRDRPQEHPEPRTVNLCAPVDVAVNNENLYIAVAAQNQIWHLDLARNQIGVLAGSGKFGLEDGEAAYASFAQPAAIAVLAGILLVADAAAGAVRAIRLSDRKVTTLLGVGPFEFGDAGGKRDTVRLQHPLGLCVDPRGLVFVADSYNDKLKALNLKSGEVRAFNLKYRFSQPEGVSIGAGALWVANTNLHEIVRVDLGTGACQRIPVGE